MRKTNDDPVTVAYLDAKLYRWAAIINSLACIIIDGDPTDEEIVEYMKIFEEVR